MQRCLRMTQKVPQWNELIHTQFGNTKLLRQAVMAVWPPSIKPYQLYDRFPVVKVLLTNQSPEFTARFQREAHDCAPATLNILPIYDYGEQDSLRYGCGAAVC